MARAACTLLLLTRDSLVRADLSRSPRPTLLSMWTQPRPTGAELPVLGEMGLATGGKPGSQVWVLTTDFWTQTLALPAAKTMGMPAPEIAAALNFEAEALSGLSAFEATTGYVSLPASGGEQNYWLTQGRSSDREQTAEIVHKAGAKLAGLCHPGGLPRPMEQDASGQSWQRLELWPDAVVCLHGTPGQPVRVQVLNADPQMGRWQNEWLTWQQAFDPVDRTEILVAPGVIPPPLLDQGRLFTLDNEAALAAWLVAWVEQTASKTGGVPVLRPVPRPLSTAQRGLIAAGIAVLVGGACVGHYLWLDRRIQEEQAELRQLQGPAQRLAEVQKQIKEHEAQRDELLKTRDDLERQTQRLLLQRRRLAQLLRVLAEVKATDLLIQKIDTDPNGAPRIQGVCLQPELADQFAKALAERLRGLGWDVQSPKKQAQNLTAQGGPWSFEIVCLGTWHQPETQKAPTKPAPRK